MCGSLLKSEEIYDPASTDGSSRLPEPGRCHTSCSDMWMHANSSSKLFNLIVHSDDVHQFQCYPAQYVSDDLSRLGDELLFLHAGAGIVQLECGVGEDGSSESG